MEEQLGQGLQTLLTCHLGTGAPAWLIGQVDVLECRGVPGRVNAPGQFVGHLLLFGNGLDDGLFALGYFLQLFRTIADGSNLYLVQSARALLAITGNEGNGTSLVQELECVLYGMLIEVQFRSNQMGECL